MLFNVIIVITREHPKMIKCNQHKQKFQIHLQLANKNCENHITKIELCQMQKSNSIRLSIDISG